MNLKKIYLKGSKSISNRALLIASLAKGVTKLSNLLICEDTEIMIAALKKLGVKIELNGNQCIITGKSELKQSNATLYMGNAGTAMRPLTSVIAASRNLKNIQLDCNKRMQERPIKPLVTALQNLQADINYKSKQDFPPLIINGKTINHDTITIDGTLSSQFVSAILISSTLFQNGLTINITGKITSKPYIDMTIAVMQVFGVQAIWQGNSIYVASNQKYQAVANYAIEPDASTASYFLAAGSITKTAVQVMHLTKNSMQGELNFCNALIKMGAAIEYKSDSIIAKANKKLKGINIDARKFIDSAMGVAILALFADDATKITNIGNWRIKETDRIEALSNELTKLGAKVTTGQDWIKIIPPTKLQAAKIETYEDHRIAMCFAVAQLKIHKIEILNQKCVNKTCPDFFTKILEINNALN